MKNPFQVQHNNPFTKSINVKGSPLLGNGKIHNFNLPSLNPIGKSSQSQPNVNHNKKGRPVWVRPWQVNTPQPLVQVMVKESSLREIFNESYFQDLFEMSMMSSPTAGVAPIGGGAIRRLRRFSGKQSYSQHPSQSSKTPVYMNKHNMGSIPAHFTSDI